MTEIQTFSSIDFVGQCLIDRERTEAFEKAVQAVIQPGMKVLDMGTGTGILALFAARAGGEVTALEFDASIAKVAAHNFEINGFGDKVELIIGDARTQSYGNKKFDVVAAELLTTGIVDEYQVQAVNNVHRQGAADSSTVFIPERQETYVTLGYHEYSRYGFAIPFVKHLWRFHKPEDVHFTAFTDKMLLHSIAFTTTHDDVFTGAVTFTATTDGTINCIHLSSSTVLHGDIKIGGTDSINAPMAIPLEVPRAVKAGETLHLSVNYIFGNGYGDFSAQLT